MSLAGPGIVRSLTSATGSGSPARARKPSAANRASAGDISFSGGIACAAICCNRPAAMGSIGISFLLLERESFIAIGGDFVTLLAIGRDTTEVRHEHPGLARNVGP